MFKSVCQGYLRLNKADRAMIFSFVICFFSIGCVLGGLLAEKRPPRIAGISGTLRWEAAFCAPDCGSGRSPAVYAFPSSAPVGLSCAFLYPAVMSCAQKWYADKKAGHRRSSAARVGISSAVLTWLEPTSHRPVGHSRGVLRPGRHAGSMRRG